MKYLLTLIEKVHEKWLNDNDYMYLLSFLQKKIDKMIAEEALCANNAEHYITLFDFKQAEICEKKATRIDSQLYAITDLLSTHRHGYLILSHISI